MIGKKLRDLRLKKGCTLSVVAKETGISAASLSKYERGFQNPGDLALLRLSEFYEVKRDELLEEKNPQESGQEHTRDKMCPWRIRQGTDQGSGDTITCFQPCLGEQCMAYENGLCIMMGNCRMVRG